MDVAYVGIATPESFSKSTPAYFQDGQGNYLYRFCQGGKGQELYDAVQESVDEALAEGAEYVVAVGHLGNTGITPEWSSKAVIANTSGIDVFISGINAEFEQTLQEVVATSPVDLTTLDPDTGQRAVRRAETNLGDLCADAYRAVGESDVAFVNGGGIRADIAAGEITYEDIINVHPFGNELCVAEVSGRELLDALEMGASDYPLENGGFLHVSGMTYAIDASVPSSVVTNEEGEFVAVTGEYRVKNVTIGGEPLDTEKTYTLASHNFMLKSGGDGYAMFRDNKIVRDSVMLDNAALIQYIPGELGGVVSDAYADPRGQGRITVLGEAGEDDPAAGAPEEDVPGGETESGIPGSGGTAAAETTSYVVRSGDTLWGISVKMYGTGTRCSAIYEANRATVKSPSLIYTGQVLKIPAA